MNLPLKINEEIIDSQNIWKDDTLSRKIIADGLTNIVASEMNSMVLCVDGGWGTGKTFLLQRWHAQLEKDGYEAIYYNAWEDDFNEDPFIAILGQMWGVVKNVNESDITKKIKNTAKSLAFNMIKTGMKKHVDLDDPKLRSVSNQIIEKYKNSHSDKKKLKEVLNQLSEKVFQKTNHPLVFIVDELD
ncbi:KAP family NTPase [bacterium]|nr:KAP family NTPase [bacterium]